MIYLLKLIEGLFLEGCPASSKARVLGEDFELRLDMGDAVRLETDVAGYVELVVCEINNTAWATLTLEEAAKLGEELLRRSKGEPTYKGPWYP